MRCAPKKIILFYSFKKSVKTKNIISFYFEKYLFNRFIPKNKYILRCAQVPPWGLFQILQSKKRAVATRECTVGFGAVFIGIHALHFCTESSLRAQQSWCCRACITDNRKTVERSMKETISASHIPPCGGKTITYHTAKEGV